MAVPKKKISKSKRGTRRAHDALKMVNITFDKNTGEAKLSHHISMVDGMYGDKKIFTPKVRNKLPDTEEQAEEAQA